MSLNRSEQLVRDYVESHPEEKTYWVDKVNAASREAHDDHHAASRLSEALWNYYEERSAVASPFRELAAREGLRRTSMRNLAEYWLRLWAPRRTKRPPAAQNNSDYF